MFSWLHLKYDDIQKWYVGGYLEIRWKSYFIGLHYLMCRFFLFITNTETLQLKEAKWSWSRPVFSIYFQPTDTLKEDGTFPLVEVVGPWHHMLQYKGVCLCQIWIPCFLPFTIMFTIFYSISSFGTLPCVPSFILFSHTQHCTNTLYLLSHLFLITAHIL